MSSLRRRIFGEPNTATTPPSPTSSAQAEEVRLAPISKIITGSHEEKISKKHKKRRNGFIFGLGGLFGLFLAGFFANKSDLIEFPEIGEFKMENLMDVLPSGFMREARELSVSCLLEKGTLTLTAVPERRTRSSELRLLLRRTSTASGRHTFQSPGGDDARSHINGT